jgi:hypothetical protein
MKKYFEENPRMDTQIRLMVVGFGIVVGAVLWLSLLLGLLKF